MRNLLVAIVGIFLVVCNLQAQKAKTKKPNVLLIYTDDHRYSGIHALGGQAVITPNMDNLVHDGIAFSKTYLMGAFHGGTCVPSRAQLHSGRRVLQLKGIGRVIPKEHISIGETFKKAGYTTHMIGKWHQDNASLARSFDGGGPVMSRGVYLTDHYRMPLWDWKKDGKYKKEDGYLLVYNKEGEVVRIPVSKDDKKGPFGTELNGPHTSEIYADNAVKYFENNDKKKPFFMYLAFHAPHDPRQAPKKYQDMYPRKDIDLLPSYLPQHPFDNGQMQSRDESLDTWPRTEEIAKEHLGSYYAIISHMDAQIGRVVAQLKATGQYENTIIVLAGDSGLAVGNHGLLGKQNIYDEDGIHVPFIISGGAIKDKGRKIDALSYIHDIYPTVCDVANIPIPASVTGKSLMPVIKGEKEQVRDYTYHIYRQHQRAYRKGGFKLIEFVKAKDKSKKSVVEFESGSRATLLFNIDKDPWETTNLAFLAEYKDLVKRMQTEMKEKAIELNDRKESVDQDYDFWDYY